MVKPNHSPKSLQSPSHDSSKSGWHRVSHSDPCPICQKPDNCTVSGDGLAVWCGRISDGSTRTNGGGQSLHILGQRERLDFWVHPSHRKRPVPTTTKPVDLKAVLVRAAGPDLQSRRAELADLLGVSADALAALGLGFGDIHGSECWTFPERDGEGRVIGINRRLLNHSKRAIPGGARGLTYADCWDKGGPVLLPEGGSDVAALVTLGLSAIGRPSNSGGTDLLADLLELEPSVTPERLIVVVAEDDRLKGGQPRKVPHDHKTDCQGCGICWPGLDGARRTAKGLADLLRRPVAYAMPPDGAKDSRSWLQQFGDVADPVELGQRFLHGLLQTITVVEPPEILQVVSVAKDIRPVRDLADIRLELMQSRRDIIGRPGNYIDQSETGTGKTFVDLKAAIECVQGGGKALLLVPTHANGDELLASASAMLEQVQQEITVAKYPKRVSVKAAEKSGLGLPGANCWNGSADIAQGMGLNVFQTVCVGCRHRTVCQATGYLSGLQSARDADITIACHARAASQGLAELSSGRQYIAVHENPTDLVKPSAAVPEADIHFAVDVLYMIRNNPANLGDDDDGLEDDLLLAVDHLLDAAEDLREAVKAAETTGPVELRWIAKVEPKTFGLLLRATFWQQRAARLLESPVWKLLLAAASGELSSLHVCVDRPFAHKGGERVIAKTLLGIWSNPIPQSATVVWADATTGPVELERMVGRVTDITPAGRATVKHRLVQIPLDVTKKGSAKRATAIVRGVLADRPEWEHVGIICHREHAETFKAMPTACKVAYFGQGDERSSNEWKSACDVVFNVGTPRVNSASIRQWLLVMGLHEAAAIPEPEWKPYLWTATTEEGQPTAVKSSGYTHPDWRAGYLALVRSELRQCIGRGRVICDDGKPVVVISVEECGLPITSAAADSLNETDATVLEQLNRATAENPIGDHIGKSAVSVPVPLAKLLELVRAAGADIQARRLREILGELERRGLVLRVGQRKGWLPVRSQEPEPPEEVETEPEPMVATKTDSLERSSRVPSEVDDGLVVLESVQIPDLTIERVPYHRSLLIPLTPPSATP